jgi:hypothetical protein
LQIITFRFAPRHFQNWIEMSTAKKERYVAIFGGFTHEGIESSLAARGLKSAHYSLYNKTPKLWSRRVGALRKLNDSGALAGAILYLPTTLVLQASLPEYQECWEELLHEATRTKSLALVFADNLSMEFRPRSKDTGEPIPIEEIQRRLNEYIANEWNPYKWSSVIDRVTDAANRKQDVERFFKSLFSAKVEISPFWKRSDTTVRIERFLEDIDENVFLRLYIPNDRFQSDQIAAFLRSFERYLREVEQADFTIEIRKTEFANIYVFRGGHAEDTLSNFEDALSRFDDFMKLCRDDPSRAVTLLQQTKLPKDGLPFLVAKYSRDYQRLVLDARHELEQKRLLLAQRLELDVLQLGEGNLPPNLQTTGPSFLLNISGNSGSLNLHLGELALGDQRNISQVVGDVIEGSITYNDEDRRILNIIEQHATRLEGVQLKSDLDQVKDKSTPLEQKKTSMQRIAGFLYKEAGKVADHVAQEVIKAAIKYVMSGFGGSIPNL